MVAELWIYPLSRWTLCTMNYTAMKQLKRERIESERPSEVSPVVWERGDSGLDQKAVIDMKRWMDVGPLCLVVELLRRAGRVDRVSGEKRNLKRWAALDLPGWSCLVLCIYHSMPEWSMKIPSWVIWVLAGCLMAWGTYEIKLQLYTWWLM